MKDEIEGVKQYSIEALKYKTSSPEFAQVYPEAAKAEMEHFNRLHEQTVKLADEAEKSGKVIPRGMKEKYEYMHEQLIEEQIEAKQFLDMFDNAMQRAFKERIMDVFKETMDSFQKKDNG